MHDERNRRSGMVALVIGYVVVMYAIYLVGRK